MSEIYYPTAPPPKPGPLQTFTVMGSAGLSTAVTVQQPGTPGTLYDSMDAPASVDFSTYTWNQAMIAMFGGAGDGTAKDSNGKTIPGDGTYGNPRSMETAHYALCAIAQSFLDYAENIQKAADAITGGSWQGPAADAFSKTIAALVKYLDDMAERIVPFVTSSGETLLTLAERLDMAGAVAGTIWGASTNGTGHDRSSAVTMSGAFNQAHGTMRTAAQAMLTDLDHRYGTLI